MNVYLVYLVELIAAAGTYYALSTASGKRQRVAYTV